MAIGLAFVDIVGDTSRTEGQIERDMNRVLAVVEDVIDPVAVRAAVEAGTGAELQRELRGDIQSVQAALQSVQVNAELSPETRARLTASLRETLARARASAGELQLRIDNQAIVTETTVAVVEAVRVAEAVAPPIELEVKVDKDTLGRLGQGFSKVAGAAAGVVGPVAGIAAGLGTAIPLAAGLAAAVASIAPAAGLAATGLLTVVSVQAAIKIGMLGIEDAVKAALDPSDPEAYAEALKGLAPNAQSFVKEIHSLQPALDGLRKSVQNQLFENLGKTIRTTASVDLPILSGALTTTAGSLNVMARDVLNTATGLGKSGVLGQALGSANAGLANLTGIPATIVQGLVQVGAAAGPAFKNLTAAAGNAADTLSQKLSGAFASGSLQKAIETAVGLVGDLFEVVGNVGSIIGSVFGAAQVSGGGFIGTLKEITGSLRTAFASPAVQEGLKALFSTMSLLAQTAGPLLAQALGVIGPALVALSEPVKILINALGQALQPIIAALGPVLLVVARTVGQLVVALSPLLPVIGQIVALIGPILVPIVGALGTIFGQLAPLVSQVAALLAGVLTPILAQLPAIITPILAVFTTLTGALLPALSQWVTALTPALTQLSMSFAEVFVALGPLIAQLAVLLGKFLEKMMPLLLPIIETVGKLAAIFAGGLAQAITTVVVPALQTVTSLLRGDFSGAFESGKQAVSGLGEFVVQVFEELPVAVGGALSNLAGSLFRAGNDLILSLIRGIKSKIPDVKNVLSDLTDLLPDWKGPAERDRKLLTPAGQTIIQGLIAGIASQVPALRSQLGGITDMVAGTSMGMPGVQGGAGGTFSGLSAASRLAASAGQVNVTSSAPTVQVFLGTRELTDIVDVRIASNNRTQGRLVTNGMRS
jgi:phage-related protein